MAGAEGGEAEVVVCTLERRVEVRRDKTRLEMREELPSSLLVRMFFLSRRG